MTKPTDRGSELCNLSNMHIMSAKEERNFSSSRTLKMLILLLFSLSKFKSAPCTSFGGKAQQLKSDVFLPYTWRLPSRNPSADVGCSVQRDTLMDQHDPLSPQSSPSPPPLSVLLSSMPHPSSKTQQVRAPSTERGPNANLDPSTRGPR